jgi:hypothetical protein
VYTDSTNAQPSQVPWGTPAVQQSARRFSGAASWRRLGFRAACYALSSGGPLVGGVVEPPWTEGAPHDAGGQTLIVVVIECTTATGALPTSARSDPALPLATTGILPSPVCGRGGLEHAGPCRGVHLSPLSAARVHTVGPTASVRTRRRCGWAIGHPSAPCPRLTTQRTVCLPSRRR